MSTAIVERTFSTMTCVLNCLRNRIRDKWLSDSLIVYIGNDVFDNIENDEIMKCYNKINYEDALRTIIIRHSNLLYF